MLFWMRCLFHPFLRTDFVRNPIRRALLKSLVNSLSLRPFHCGKKKEKGVQPWWRNVATRNTRTPRRSNTSKNVVSPFSSSFREVTFLLVDGIKENTTVPFPLSTVTITHWPFPPVKIPVRTREHRKYRGSRRSRAKCLRK